MIGSHLNIHTAKTAQEALQRKNELLHSDNITLEKIINERTDELRTLNTKLQEQLEYINEIATRDKLTSVYNRHMFEELLNKEMQRARRYTRPLSLVMVDADFFKEINDRYGHQTGDAVLKELAGMLVSNLRDSDIIARWGGEEFVAILPDTTQEAAAALAEALRVKIARSSFAENIQLTCSFGITSYRHSDTLNNLFARIDRALYRAKEYQRNNVQSE
jgi:diguanylate cyclase (GGDEF)-like protein